MPSLLWKTDFDGRKVLVAAGLFATERGDVAAATGGRLFLFVPEDAEYRLRSELDLKAGITGLAAGRPGVGRENRDDIVVSTAEKIIIAGIRREALAVLAQAGPEPGAQFADVAAGDLDGDGRYEIVAAASGQETIYVYRTAGAADTGPGIELVGIRVVPGSPRFVEVFPGPGGRPAIAVAYQRDGGSGLALYYLTARGFEAGPVLEALPFVISSLAAGNFMERPGTELAFGGAGGTVWLVGAGEKLDVLMVTDSLGTAVSALAGSGNDTARLMAGTPEGNVFIFNYPVGKSPDLAFSTVEGVTGLAALPGERVAAGTSMGGLQVWSLSPGSSRPRGYIVMPGDTLWIISKKFGVPVEQILSVNQNIKNPEVIMPGQLIKIPAP
ncbi:MAG: LysM peptidoglycan-binding domain-containing protein [Bacillota bacterium]